MGIVAEAMQKFIRPEVPPTGLVLYHHPHNFFSQKIMIALHEKQIPFTAQLVDITKGEQYSAWFLELNPRGEVPVLQNGVQIIPESNRIIKYLEDHFNEEKYPKLLPVDDKSEIYKQIVYLNSKISRLPIGAISMGVIVHSELRQNSKPPLDNVTLESLLTANHKARQALDEYALNVDASHAEGLISRSNMQLKKITTPDSREELMFLLDSVHAVLNDIEDHLRLTHFADSNPDDSQQWLCGQTISVADLSLTVLLHRLSSLGLEHIFWKPDRPLIGLYYERCSARESFRQSLPTHQQFSARLEVLLSKFTPIQIASAMTVFSAIVVMVPFWAMTSK